MEIYTTKKGNIIVISIVGDLDVNSSELIEVIGWHVRNNRLDFVCNLENINLIDRSGISALTIAYNNVVSHKGRLKLCCIPTHIRNLFESICLDTVFEIYISEEEAINSFKPGVKNTSINNKPLRRRFCRLDIDIPVEFRLKYSRTDDFHTGKAFNLSGVGMFIFSEKTYAVGSELSLQVKLSSKLGAVEVSGIVLWLADKDTQPQLYPGMGIEFMGIRSEVQNKILDFIERNSPSSSAA